LVRSIGVDVIVKPNNWDGGGVLLLLRRRIDAADGGQGDEAELRNDDETG